MDIRDYFLGGYVNLLSAVGLTIVLIFKYFQTGFENYFLELGMPVAFTILNYYIFIYSEIARRKIKKEKRELPMKMMELWEKWTGEKVISDK